MNPIKTDLNTAEASMTWAALLTLATQEVFSMMLGSDVVTLDAPAPDEGLDVTSMVGLGGQVSGIVTVRCSAESAILIAGKMLEVDCDQSKPKMSDAVGEVCNMIAGNFKNKIAGMGDGCLLSVPTVMTGDNVYVYSHENSHRTSISLDFEGKPINVTLDIQN